MPIRVIEKAHEPSTGEDIARGSGTGLVEGAAGLMGGLGDLRELGQAGVNKLLGMAHIAPAPERARTPLDNLTAVISDAAAKRLHIDPRMARLATAITMPGSLMNAPTSKDLVGALTHDKPLYQPQTKAGKYARTVAQFAPAALVPGGAVRRAANVVVPAVASEAAGQATEGSKFEPYARVAAALAGAGAVGIAGAPHPRTRMLAEASRGATDADIATARTLMEQAQAEGVQLTMPEAVQQVTGGATGLARLQRVVEGTPAGGERIAPLMAERPNQVRQAVGNFADTIAPPTAQPSVIGGQAQQAAEGGLTQVRRFINFGADPHYEALEGQTLPAADYARLAADPSYAAALQGLRGHPELGAAVAHLPDENLSVVNEVVKRLNTGAEQARPGPMNPQGDNGLASLRDQGAGLANEVAGAASADWRAARDAVSAGRQAYLEPLQRGPLGVVAGTDSVKAQTAALYPSQPLEGAADETVTALRMLGTQNPALPRDLTRQHLVNSLNEATQNLQGGENQYGGARYAVAVAGNPEQERALLGGVEAAGGDPDRLRRIVEALQATGRRERPGSMTSFNTRAIEEMGKAGAAGEVLRTGLNAPGAFRRVGVAFQDWQTSRNAGHLAEAILANPEDAERILLHAREVVPQGEGLQTIERLAIAAQSSRQPQLEGR